MFYELFATKTREWLMCDLKNKRVATVDAGQAQIFQTLKFRLVIATSFYALFNMFEGMALWLKVGISIAFYGLMAFYYYNQLLPSLKWKPLEESTQQQQDEVHSFFQMDKLLMRLAIVVVLAIIALIALGTQSGSTITLERLICAMLALTFIMEGLRQLRLIWQLKRQG